LRELETIGLIARVSVGDDWRTKGAKLTSKGATVCKALDVERSRIAARAMGDLSDNEYELLVAMLIKIHGSIEDSGGGPA